MTQMLAPANSGFADFAGFSGFAGLVEITQASFIVWMNCMVIPGGGGYLTKFCTGRLRPEFQPLTLSYTILAEKVPLLYTFY